MNAITTKSGKEVTLKSVASSAMIQQKFREVLGDKAPIFIQSVVTTTQNNPALLKANPMSVFGSAMTAATLNLSVVPTLGQAAIIPYGDKAQFQIMVRGLVQLAQRTGLYSNINTGEVYEDEYDGEDLLTGEISIHRVKDGYRDNGRADKIIGYFAHIETTTGFKKTEYWTVADVRYHARRFSKSFSSGPWKDNFGAMAKKTVLKSLLNHYGPMSVDSQLAQAISKDQMITDKDGHEDYEDNPMNDFIGVVDNISEPEGKTIPETAENATQAVFTPSDTTVADEGNVPSFDF